jgi:ABC-type multidrug transport system fused ATPase/permease subunit
VRTLLRLWPYVRPVRLRLFTAAFVAIVASCVGLVIPLVLKWLVDGPVADRDLYPVRVGRRRLEGQAASPGTAGPAGTVDRPRDRRLTGGEHGPQGRPHHQDPGSKIAVRPPHTRTKTYFRRRTVS